VRKLLLELERHPGNREARFVCALAMAQCGKILCETEGECRGEIATDPRGTQGFGYDPVFVVPEPRCLRRRRIVAAIVRAPLPHCYGSLQADDRPGPEAASWGWHPGLT
jgi:hypothetical protein